MMPLLRRT